MNLEMMDSQKFPYRYHPTPLFSAKLEKVRQQDPKGHSRILKVIERLLQFPGDADGRMQGVFHGKLKKYVGRRDYRLIYHWCEECRKAARQVAELCGECDRVGDHSVVFFDLYHKNEPAYLKHLA